MSPLQIPFYPHSLSAELHSEVQPANWPFCQRAALNSQNCNNSHFVVLYSRNEKLFLHFRIRGSLFLTVSDRLKHAWMLRQHSSPVWSYLAQMLLNC